MCKRGEFFYTMDNNVQKDLEKLKINHSGTHGNAIPRRGILLLFGVLALVLAILFIFKDSFVSSRKFSIITVQAQSPAPSPDIMTAGGYIVAESEITVSSKVAGRIVTLPVREGDEVTEGDILATLDNEELRVQMEEAEANFEKAKLNLKHKEALYQKDAIDLQRRRELFKGDLISPSQLDDEEKNLVIAQLELDKAKSELEVCEKKVRLATIRLEEAIIRAPISGTVIDKIADLGEMLFPMKTMEGKSGSAVVTLADLKVMNVEIDLNEDDLKKISLGKPALITPDSFPDRTYRGEVIEISPMADRQKNVVPIKVRVKNPDTFLKPDMSARVTFQEEDRDRSSPTATIQIPLTAVADRKGKNIVFVFEGEKPREREVTLGPQVGDYVVIEQGLADGEKILVESDSFLTFN